MLRAIDRFADWLAPRLQGLGVCGHTGAIAGMLAGGVLVLMWVIEEALAPTSTEALQLWLLLTFFCWLAVLLIFVVFVRWKLTSVALPSLVNTALVVGLTVLVCYLTGAYPLGFFIGLIAGMLVGLLLCSFYRRVALR